MKVSVIGVTPLPFPLADKTLCRGIVEGRLNLSEESSIGYKSSEHIEAVPPKYKQHNEAMRHPHQIKAQAKAGNPQVKKTTRQPPG